MIDMKAEKDNEEFLRRISKIEALVRELETAADSKLRTSALDLMQLLMDLHGAGFTRMLQIIHSKSNTDELIDQLAEDRLIASLLSLYGLHPQHINTRITEALARARSYWQPQGVEIELISTQDQRVKLRLIVQSNSRVSAATIRSSIEDLIYQSAPDINELEVEIVTTPPPATATTLTPTFVQLQRGSKKAAETVAELPHNQSTSQCQLCSAALSDEHQHLIELANRKFLCACRPCSMLFSAPNEKYRLIGRRKLFLPEFHLTDRQWQELAIPIGMAFFFYNSAAGRTVAVYPSPAGPAEPLEFHGWDQIVKENEILKELLPDTEALLVNRLDRRYRQNIEAEYFILPIDECYRLIGLIRAQWQGLSGGATVWASVAQFFQDLKSNCQPIGRSKLA